MLEKSLQAAVMLSLLLTTLSLLPEAAFALGPPAPPDIYIMIEPKSQVIQAGGSAVTFKVIIIPQGPWDRGNVTLSLLNPPQGVTATFSPEKKTIIYWDTFNSTMTVKAAADAPQGMFVLTVRGEGVEYSKTGLNPPSNLVRFDSQADVTLSITAPPAKTTVTTTAITTTTTTITIDAIQTQTVTVTQIGTSTNTLATTITTTITTAIAEQASDTPNYAWALSAGVATVVLATVLITQRRRVA